MPDTDPLPPRVAHMAEKEQRFQEFLTTLSCNNLDDFYRVVLDAFPSAVLIVEKDVVIVDYNTSADTLLTEAREQIIHQRFGDAIHCIHSFDTPDGCGRGPECGHCLLRQSVNRALAGTTVHRQKLEIEQTENNETSPHTYWLTTAPLTYEDRHYALLMLQPG